jgi:hypothetical protein
MGWHHLLCYPEGVTPPTVEVYFSVCLLAAAVMDPSAGAEGDYAPPVTARVRTAAHPPKGNGTALFIRSALHARAPMTRDTRTRRPLRVGEGKASGRKTNPEAVKIRERRRTLRRYYKMTPERYAEMHAAQGGKCAVCGRTTAEAGGHPHLSVDHCHRTGQIRALLCHPCNAAMGNAGDDPQRLRDLADYLERHRESVRRLRLSLLPRSPEPLPPAKQEPSRRQHGVNTLARQPEEKQAPSENQQGYPSACEFITACSE